MQNTAHGGNCGASDGSRFPPPAGTLVVAAQVPKRLRYIASQSPTAPISAASRTTSGWSRRRPTLPWRAGHPCGMAVMRRRVRVSRLKCGFWRCTAARQRTCNHRHLLLRQTVFIVRPLPILKDVKQRVQIVGVWIKPSTDVFSHLGDDATVMPSGQNLGKRVIGDKREGIEIVFIRSRPVRLQARHVYAMSAVGCTGTAYALGCQGGRYSYLGVSRQIFEAAPYSSRCP